MLLKNQQKKIISNFLIIFNKDIIKKIYLRYYELEIKVLKKITYYFFDFLKNHSLSLFKILVDIAVIDYPKHNYRFSLIYNFLSLKYNFRLKVIFKVLNFSSIFSSSKLFKGSIWLEREIFDMFGLVFLNNNDLRRIITDYGFKWNPLKKDFPLIGYVEIIYNDNNNLLSYKPVNLVQDFRIFKFF